MGERRGENSIRLTLSRHIKLRTKRRETNLTDTNASSQSWRAQFNRHLLVKPKWEGVPIRPKGFY
eukprot:Pgem_evm1s5445